MWSGDKLMQWNEGAQDWLEAPLGLRLAIRDSPRWARQRRRSLWRDSVVIALFSMPFAALISAAPRIFAGRTLGIVWFFVSLVWFGLLGYWVMRGRS
jgi:hypothetical protein